MGGYSLLSHESDLRCYKELECFVYLLLQFDIQKSK